MAQNRELLLVHVEYIRKSVDELKSMHQTTAETVFEHAERLVRVEERVKDCEDRKPRRSLWGAVGGFVGGLVSGFFGGKLGG